MFFYSTYPQECSHAKRGAFRESSHRPRTKAFFSQSEYAALASDLPRISRLSIRFPSLSNASSKRSRKCASGLSECIQLIQQSYPVVVDLLVQHLGTDCLVQGVSKDKEILDSPLKATGRVRGCRTYSRQTRP